MLQWEEAGQCYMGTFCRGDKAAFIAHVFVALKNFVLNNLQLRLFVSQVMAKHCKDQ
jgi:hypothetical protein